MSQRVTHAETVRSTHAAGVTEHPLVPGCADSELALATLVLAAGTATEVGDAAADSLLFCVAGSGTLACSGGAVALGTGAAALVPAGTAGVLSGGSEGLEVVLGRVGAACDLHAPMGAAAPVEQLEEVEPGKATGARSFQVLYDATNGSSRATLFVGHIPPGKAPWHYHLYDEIVWVLRGEGRLHLADTVEPLAPGSAFRLHPREVHIVENTSIDRELSVLGLFTPAGSPSAAYLTPGVFAEYAASAR